MNITMANILTFDPGAPTPSDSESEEPRMIGDFDGSAKEFWNLYRNEAKGHDDARFDTLKDYMQNSLVFVRSYPICTDGLGRTDA
jgi:hypothetical protein